MYYVFCMYICIYTPTLYVRINQLPRKLAVAWHTSATLRRLPWHTPSVGSPEHFEDKVSHQGHQLFDMFIYIYYIIEENPQCIWVHLGTMTPKLSINRDCKC